MFSLFLILALGLAGPLLAWPRRLALPVALGELLVGVAFGASGLRVLDVHDQSIQLISQVGFALVMMLVGSHISVRQTFSSGNLVAAVRNILISVVFALTLAWVLVQLTGIDHLAIYALIMASSSAAVVLPLVASKTAPSIGLLVTQVAVADLLAIIALPAVMALDKLPQIAVGATVITVCAVVLYLALSIAVSNGSWKALRSVSRDRGFGLELRISLLVLLGLAALAQNFGVSVMIAGFAIGLAISANGVPRRLAKQLFAVTEGFFAPVFYVSLGAAVDFRLVFSDSKLLTLAALLAVFALLSHLGSMLFGQRLSEAGLSSAALGIPTAVVSIGLSSGVLSSAEAAAITLAMVFSLLMAALFARKI